MTRDAYAYNTFAIYFPKQRVSHFGPYNNKEL